MSSTRLLNALNTTYRQSIRNIVDCPERIFYYSHGIYPFQVVTAWLGALCVVVALSFGAWGSTLGPAVMMFMPWFTMYKRKHFQWAWPYSWLFPYKCDFRKIMQNGITAYTEGGLNIAYIVDILEYCDKHLKNTNWTHNRYVLRLAKKNDLIRLRMMFPLLDESIYGKLIKD